MSDNESTRRAGRVPTQSVVASRCGRRFVLMASLAAVFGALPAGAEDTYRLDAGLGTIEFTVRNFGLFTSHGQFRHFTATFVLDAAQPARTRIAVEVDAASVDMPWQDGAALLRSADFFDVQQYPKVRFNSTSVESLATGGYRVSGLLEMRGVTRPIALDATLVGTSPRPGQARGGGGFCCHRRAATLGVRHAGGPAVHFRHGGHHHPCPPPASRGHACRMSGPPAGARGSAACTGGAPRWCCWPFRSAG